MLLTKINSYPNLKKGAAHRGATVYVYKVTGTEEEMKSYKDIKGDFHRVDEETGNVLFFSSDIPAGINADGSKRTKQLGNLGNTATLEVAKNGKGEPALRTVISEQTQMKRDVLELAASQLATLLFGDNTSSAPVAEVGKVEVAGARAGGM